MLTCKVTEKAREGDIPCVSAVMVIMRRLLGKKGMQCLVSPRDPYPLAAGPLLVDGTGRDHGRLRCSVWSSSTSTFPSESCFWTRYNGLFFVGRRVNPRRRRQHHYPFVACYQPSHPDLRYSVLCHPPLRCALVSNSIHSTANYLGSFYTPVWDAYNHALDLCSTIRRRP